MYPTISPVRRSSRCNKVVTSRFKDYDMSNLHTHEGKCDSCAQRESTGNNTQLTKISVALVISTRRVMPTNPTHIKPTTQPPPLVGRNWESYSLIVYIYRFVVFQIIAKLITFVKRIKCFTYYGWLNLI